MTRPQAWPKVDPGRMVHRIQLQVRSAGHDSFGAPHATWITVIQTWAAIDPVRGIDVIQSGQETKQSLWTVTIRWQSGIVPDMQIKTEDGEAFLIQSIENPGKRNILLVLNCLAFSEQ